MCHLALFLASEALYVSDPCFLKQYSNSRSRVVQSPNPQKCALVAASLDIGLLADTPPTLEGASGGGLSIASTMAFVAACIYGIFCSPSLSANQVHSLYQLLGLCVIGFPDLGVVGVVLPLTLVFRWGLFEGPKVVLLVLRPVLVTLVFLPVFCCNLGYIGFV